MGRWIPGCSTPDPLDEPGESQGKGVNALFKTNVSFWDRWARSIAGAVLFFTGVLRLFGLSYDLGVIFAVIGLVLVLTGAFGYCPLYGICGFGGPRGGGSSREHS